MTKTIEARQPTGQRAIIVRALQRKPMTAQQILKATGGTTPHNSYSLKLIAKQYGFKFSAGEDKDGYMTYAFAPIAAAKQAAAVAVKRAPRKVAKKA
jgi:hypothetical protein